jgi:uncharacterized protein YjbI with pentapeptide repeats
MPQNVMRTLFGLLFPLHRDSETSSWIAPCVVLAASLVSVTAPAAETSQSAQPPKAVTLPASTGAAGNSLSCAFCNLQGIDLSGRNLTNANLAGADLRNANLKGAILDGAILIGSNLENADVSSAKLNASSRGHADLSRANLAGANFQGAALKEAALLFAGLEGTDFTGADLTAAMLGPRPKTGVHKGRATSFRNAKVERQFAPDPATADVNGTQWIERKEGVSLTATPDGIACGNSDLSNLGTAFYVSTQGNDTATCGVTPATACQTLAHGIARCAGNACNLLVMFDEFALHSTLALNTTSVPKGAHLYGGCLPAGQADPSYRSALQAPPGGLPAVSVANVPNVILENFKLLGSAATGTQASPSMTLTVIGSTGLTLINSELVGGTGAPGAGGGTGNPGTGGGSASGQTAGTNSSCANTQGGTGAGQMGGDNHYTYCTPSCGADGCYGGSGGSGGTGIYASGGGWGNPGGYFCPPISANAGSPGGAGNNGSCGTGGPASSDIKGTFSGATWKPSSGQSGNPGLDGGGGGGGGSGAYVCGNCFLVPWQYAGNTGGGGGAGGCGGGPGGGGQQGGGSFTVVAVSSTVTLNQTRVISGRSGDGGSGGPAGTGGSYGAGASGAGQTGTHYSGCMGGAGNNAGGGGGGGGGAAGNGGPSIGVALINGATVNGTGLVYYAGNSGAAGGVGAGGTGAACPADGFAGQPGTLGLVSDTQTYP